MEVLFQRRVRLALAGLWGLGWLVVAALLLLPVPVATPSRFDLVVHFLLFGAMALGAMSFAHRPSLLALMAGLTIAGGTALELAQGLTSYRTFDLIDATANALGAAFGFAVALALLHYWIGPADPRRRGGAVGAAAPLEQPTSAVAPGSS